METGQRASSLFIVALALSLVTTISCARQKYVQPSAEYVTLEGAAKAPPGAIRYCWEEPIVELEPNGPGLDPAGEYYHASYLAVREVREGRWRPCRHALNEVKGETRNER
jgi:hypothetical protein